MLSTLGLTAVLGASSDVFCDACPPDMITAPSDNPCGFECLETVYNCDACPDYMLTVPASNSCGFDCLDYDWEWHGEGLRRRRLEEKLAISSRRRLTWPGWAKPSWENPAPAPSWNPAPAPAWNPAPAPAWNPAPAPAWNPAPAPVVTGRDQSHDRGSDSWGTKTTGPNGSHHAWGDREHENSKFNELRSDGGSTSGHRGSFAQRGGHETVDASGWSRSNSQSGGQNEHLVHHDPHTGTMTETWSSGSHESESHSWGTHGRRLEALEGLVA